MALPRGAVGWSAVCDCGIPDHTHLLSDLRLIPKNVFPGAVHLHFVMKHVVLMNDSR